MAHHNDDEDDEVIYSGTNDVQRAKRRRLLCFVLWAAFIVATAVIITAIALRFIKSNQTKFSKTRVDASDSCSRQDEGTNQSGNCICKTQICLKVAESIKKAMNLSADPCQDFNEYVCGRWHETHPLPASEDSIYPLKIINLEKNKQLRILVEDLIKRPSAHNGFKAKIMKYYQSCVDVLTIEKKGKDPLLEFLSTFGVWSPIKMWSEAGERNDLTSLIIQTHKYFTFSIENDKHYSPLFKAYVTSNRHYPTKHITEVQLGYVL